MESESVIEKGEVGEGSEAEDRRDDGDVVQREFPQRSVGRKIERIDRFVLLGASGSGEGQRSEVGRRLGNVQNSGQLSYVKKVDARERDDVLEVGQEKIEESPISSQSVQADVNGQGGRFGTLQT